MQWQKKRRFRQRAQKKVIFGLASLVRSESFSGTPKSELKKVVYPTPKQMVNNTLVVLLCVLVVGVCVWVLDAVGGLAVKGIVSLVQG